ncbi:hypothetical protein D6D24_00735 [Aureobasidium pullulans]|uniref:Uncharacterized protein n=1 Tax=Aureobasidium pullulans TaxID=5580 RepID=A0A4V4IDG1_AURPU|nr:hypothetical protein D6D24_00735 [Aureobasidium pullulans]
MHPSGPSASALNPATRMPPPPSVNQVDKERSHVQGQQLLASQDEGIAPPTSIATGDTSQSTSPGVPQDHDENDASQSSSRLRTPEDRSQSQTDSMSSPTRHKRTANGLLKVVDTPGEQRPRAESVSSSGSKAGEVAAQLKTRLAYAMIKVQHGWEHRNINEVEKLAAALHPSMAASPPASSAPIDIRSPPSKRRSGSGVVSWSLPDSGTGLHASSQSSNTFRRPSASSPVHIPSTPESRPAPVRSTMPTQQAEQDAMDALMLMGGSPGNGGKFPPSQSSSQNALHPQSQNWHNQGSAKSLNRRRSDSPTAIDRSPKRPAILSRNNSSTSEVSVANSEVREARERVLEEVEEAA